VILLDVNVLVYAFRVDAPQHADYKSWLESVLDSDEAFGLSDLVLSGFLRVVTHPKVFAPPTPLAIALRFVRELRGQPHCTRIEPGPRHWELFTGLCEKAGAKGDLVPDAFLAAMAIESGCEWISTDRDFARFAGLRTRHPLAGRT